MSRPQRQLAMKLEQRSWGGKRRGAGAPRRAERPALAHRAREPFRAAQPVHVTLRMAPHVWNLRSERSFTVIHGALDGVRPRSGFRIVHFSILGNHVHLICEADGSQALANGVRAVSIRLARRLNRLMGRDGPVFEDRYHAHVLRTPAEVRNAVRYVLGNHRRHARTWGERISSTWIDPYTSAEPRTPQLGQLSLWEMPVTRKAGTWLLRTAGGGAS
jgi:REP element-mobilizing transposase RayT